MPRRQRAHGALEAVGHPFAVNADKALRKEAAERGWPVLVFAKPVRASRRIPRPTASPIHYAGASALTAGVFVRWSLARLSRPTRAGLTRFGRIRPVATLVP